MIGYGLRSRPQRSGDTSTTSLHKQSLHRCWNYAWASHPLRPPSAPQFRRRHGSPQTARLRHHATGWTSRSPPLSGDAKNLPRAALYLVHPALGLRRHVHTVAQGLCAKSSLSRPKAPPPASAKGVPTVGTHRQWPPSIERRESGRAQPACPMCASALCANPDSRTATHRGPRSTISRHHDHADRSNPLDLMSDVGAA